MYFLISGTDIVGSSDRTDIGLPNGWEILEFEGDYSPQDLFLSPEGLKLKPEQPTPAHQWINNEWVIPELPAFSSEKSPNYLDFRLGMLQDPGYDRITIASNVLRVTRMETTVSQNPPTLEVVAAMWNTLIDELADKPKAAEVKAWNAIASAANVPIKFGKDGKMGLT